MRHIRTHSCKFVKIFAVCQKNVAAQHFVNRRHLSPPSRFVSFCIACTTLYRVGSMMGNSVTVLLQFSSYSREGFRSRASADGTAISFDKSRPQMNWIATLTLHDVPYHGISLDGDLRNYQREGTGYVQREEWNTWEGEERPQCNGSSPRCSVGRKERGASIDAMRTVCSAESQAMTTTCGILQSSIGLLQR